MTRKTRATVTEQGAHALRGEASVEPQRYGLVDVSGIPAPVTASVHVRRREREIDGWRVYPKPAAP